MFYLYLTAGTIVFALYTLAKVQVKKQPSDFNYTKAERPYATSFPTTANTYARDTLSFVGVEGDPVYGIPRRVFKNKHGQYTHDYDINGTLQPDSKLQ